MSKRPICMAARLQMAGAGHERLRSLCVKEPVTLSAVSRLREVAPFDAFVDTRGSPRRFCRRTVTAVRRDVTGGAPLGTFGLLLILLVAKLAEYSDPSHQRYRRRAQAFLARRAIIQSS